MITDARLARFTTQGVACTSCGETHNGIFDIAYLAPAPWPGLGATEENSALPDALKNARDILTEDFCVMGEHRFVRSTFLLPLQNSDLDFGFGVWGTLSPATFDSYVEAFDLRDSGRLGSAFSWLSNPLPGAKPVPVKALIHFQSGGTRPQLQITESAHPFFAVQTEGLSFDDLLEIYAQSGHDFRAAYAHG